MKILITGKGGREHALLHALNKTPTDPQLFVWPGNDAMEELAERVQASDLDALVDWMRQNVIDLCVVGEENYLEAGLSDRCLEAGIRAWGPVRKAAQLESSKLFTKDFLNRHDIPTGSHIEVHTPQELRDAVEGYPTVLKFDGLAAGKGVSVCASEHAVEVFIDHFFVERKFGAGRVFVEEYLEGKELSVICAVADGAYQMFPFARDYKRLCDGDEGPNTGGMGAVASLKLVDDDLLNSIESGIVKPVIAGLSKDGLNYRGFLYFGLMLTGEGPKVLEFNCRFGDPEAQAILPLLQGDLAQYLYEAADGSISMRLLKFTNEWSVCVIMAYRDYPNSSGHGEIISGLDKVSIGDVFHAGTAKSDSHSYHVDGGRVLSVVCRAADRDEACESVYSEIKKIRFSGAQFRSDIGSLHFDSATNADL